MMKTDYIKASQDALKRAKKALIRPGIKIKRVKNVPLYFGCENEPGLMIQELNGKKRIGRFEKGRFVGNDKKD